MAIGNSVRETERYLDVIERLNPEVNAVLTVAPEMALDMAHKADQAADDGEWLGLLHGVPMLVKDCLNVAGTRTTFGSGMYRENIANADSEVVRRIRGSGPVFLGKTNLPEFCYGATTHNVHYGNCLNPWDTTPDSRRLERRLCGSPGVRHVPYRVWVRHRRLGPRSCFPLWARGYPPDRRPHPQHQRSGPDDPRRHHRHDGAYSAGRSQGLCRHRRLRPRRFA